MIRILGSAVYLTRNGAPRPQTDKRHGVQLFSMITAPCKTVTVYPMKLTGAGRAWIIFAGEPEL